MADFWIWLPAGRYPDRQYTVYDAIEDRTNATFAVAEFTKSYHLPQDILSVSVRFCADTEVQLYGNGALIATGPPAVGGDFLGNGSPREWYYAQEAEFSPGGRELTFFARVKMCPTRLYEYSKGRGGFMLEAAVTLADGTCRHLGTGDFGWMTRRNPAYSAPRVYDGRIPPDPYVAAEIVPDVWGATTAPIPARSERMIPVGEVFLAPHGEVSRQFSLDMIYAGFLCLQSEGGGEAEVRILTSELGERRPKGEEVYLSGDDEYRSFYLDSAGMMYLSAKNPTDVGLTLRIFFIATCYPVREEAVTVTGDAGLDEILRVCRHTLRYCRQTHHLDSPAHCEPLACTGDYYIEMLMTAFSFGDMRLAEFDLLRTAELLRHSDGRMFHTSYSLIFVRMLYDTYLLGGSETLLPACRDAVDLLLARFAGYVGENGLIENPPDYMFVDWIYIDGHTMHHPPKALGQSVLNMLYFMALQTAAKIYMQLSDRAAADLCLTRASALQAAVNIHLFDSERGMYFEGLNTEASPACLGKWHPQNIEKRYYLKHSNIMAAYTGICDTATARMLIGRIMRDEIEGEVQPYYLHYLLEAIYTHGLRDTYTMAVLDRWRPAVAACARGLPEGFVAPEPTYRFDHSHAWGGTPLWSLPRALSGLTVLEAGYRRIRLCPSLLGLREATVEIPTPKGRIVCRLKEGAPPDVTLPAGVTLELAPCEDE